MPKIVKFLSYFLPIVLLVLGALMFSFSIRSLIDNAEALECFCPSCPDSNLSEKGFASLGLIKADIQGAVKKPGVYQLKIGERLSDLIKAADGFAEDADQEYVAKSLNLATELQDQDKIYVPFFDEAEAESQDAEGSKSNSEPSGSAESGLISINQASSTELKSLSGIGEVKAQAIIDGRPFSSLDELVDKGILSENLLNELKSQLSL